METRRENAASARSAVPTLPDAAPLPQLVPRRAHARPWWARADASASSMDEVADATIDAIAAEGKETLADVWQARGASELRVGSTFCAVTAQVIEHGGDEMVLTLLSQAMRDEVHHAQISVEMAARYRGDSAVLWPGPQPTHVPLFAPAEGKLRATLLVLTLCCINETVACAILEAQLASATSPLTRAAAQSILSDEIDHARAGWAHLASRHVGPELLGQLGGWLPRLLSARLDEFALNDTPFKGEQYPGVGVLSRRERKVIVRDALQAVLLPGFGRVGIDIAAATAWAEQRFGAA